MKVVLFCGGLGMRIRENGDDVPKPMIRIGSRPILWHVMKYYAHFGHKDFILCLGYRANVIKDYFLNYSECVSNDFVLSNGCKQIDLIKRDIQDWRITFVDTGPETNIGQRLRRVAKYIDDDVFLANYSDGLTDFHLPRLIEFFYTQKRTAAFLSVIPNISYHFVSVHKGGLVASLCDIHAAGLRINGGYYVFRRDIFDYIGEGEELVCEPFQRLIERGELLALPYDGFFAAMDTLKDRQYLDRFQAAGNAPWELWKRKDQCEAASSPDLVRGWSVKGA
jgi:glucose-1-phosphate cytidylyltransferase